MKEFLRKGSGIVRIVLGGLGCFASIFVIQKIMESWGKVLDVIGEFVAFALIVYFGVYLIMSGYRQILKKRMTNKIFIVLFLLTNLILIGIFISSTIDQIVAGDNHWGFLSLVILLIILEIEDLIQLIQTFRKRDQQVRSSL